MNLFGGSYRHRRVLVTGHTGFKGSWLCLWLKQLGADVSGLALPPAASPNHWEMLNLDIAGHMLDIRDGQAVARVVAEEQPEIVFHLAAQPLVRRSYSDPLETWSTNVVGTVNLLEASRGTSSVRAIVVVTTDKCYENREWPWGYRETDPLGGNDPYSASKAAAELVTASYRSSYFSEEGAPLLASARAGNVVGGGDWSQDRLIPDLVRAVSQHEPLEIRCPQATRPWQHVLESLSGYLALGQKLLERDRQFAESWNFGPDPEGNRSVAEVLTRLLRHWPELAWRTTRQAQPHEATVLYLDSAKAKQKLGWRPVWNLDRALAATADWYRQNSSTGRPESLRQLKDYVADACDSGVGWTGP